MLIINIGNITLFEIPFPDNSLLSSDQLPATLISLEDWVMVTLHGIDTIKYLQTQLTCDLSKLNEHLHIFGAHCNNKGKVLSLLCIFQYQNGIAYILRKSMLNKHITELKKYSIFSKIYINIDYQMFLLGFTGKFALEILSNVLTKIPNTKQKLVRQENMILLYFHLPISRYLFIIKKQTLNYKLNRLTNQVKLNNSKQWLLLDIEAGYPIVDLVNSAKFIPQAMNIHKINGIDFNKGCYLGQEIIARAQYRGGNKYALCLLVGIFKSTPNIGVKLEIKKNGNWYSTGTVLAVCKLQNGETWLQAILNNSLLPLNTKIRIQDEDDCVFLTKKFF